MKQFGRFLVYCVFFAATWFLNLFIVALFSTSFSADASATISDIESFCFLVIPIAASIAETIAFAQKWAEKRNLKQSSGDMHNITGIQPVAFPETSEHTHHNDSASPSDPGAAYCSHCGAKIAIGTKCCSVCGQNLYNYSVPVVASNQNTSVRSCPRCRSHTITYQTVTESRKSGCGTVLLYVFLAFTVFGLLIVIPLMLRKKTETVTYAVCQNCGNRWRIN